MKREQIIETVNSFPPEVDLDALIDRLVFMDKVNKGLDQLDKGEGNAHQSVIERLNKKWGK
jgi:hypothetical protein